MGKKERRIEFAELTTNELISLMDQRDLQKITAGFNFQKLLGLGLARANDGSIIRVHLATEEITALYVHLALGNSEGFREIIERHGFGPVDFDVIVHEHDQRVFDIEKRLLREAATPEESPLEQRRLIELVTELGVTGQIRMRDESDTGLPWDVYLKYYQQRMEAHIPRQASTIHIKQRDYWKYKLLPLVDFDQEQVLAMLPPGNPGNTPFLDFSIKHGASEIMMHLASNSPWHSLLLTNDATTGNVLVYTYTGERERVIEKSGTSLAAEICRGIPSDHGFAITTFSSGEKMAKSKNGTTTGLSPDNVYTIGVFQNGSSGFSTLIISQRNTSF